MDGQPHGDGFKNFTFQKLFIDQKNKFIANAAPKKCQEFEGAKTAVVAKLVSPVPVWKVKTELG
uniref:Uncharacterized protein n=1 Tax=Romanomermis culicivorax TaxID=13658 RepID=A0A915K0D8_ROMCU